MDDGTNSKDGSRPPTLEDLIELCRHLNDANARYVIIGGFAMNYHGMGRATKDIDLLVDSSEENLDKIKLALLYLSDQAIRLVNATDVETYNVVRVADELLIDLMGSSCGLRFDDVCSEIETETIQGIILPFLNAEAMLKTKQSLRPQDQWDRMYLEMILSERGK